MVPRLSARSSARPRSAARVEQRLEYPKVQPSFSASLVAGLQSLLKKKLSSCWIRPGCSPWVSLPSSPSSASRLFRFLVLAGLPAALLHPAAAGCSKPSRQLVLLGLESNWAFPPDGYALAAINLVV